MSTDTPAVLWYTYCALKGGEAVTLLWRCNLKQVAALVKIGVAMFPYEKEVGDKVTKRCEMASKSVMLNRWQLERTSTPTSGERFSASTRYGHE